jgi:flagellar basal-body rod protein FlgC
MEPDSLFKALDISASGLRAEWVRMQVVANNVANADTTQTPEGGPYRKQHVVFSTLLGGLNGVHVDGIVPSDEAPRMIHIPGHPHADAKGFVAMPAVQVPTEMIDLMMASRAFEANLAAMRRFRSICEEALNLLR